MKLSKIESAIESILFASGEALSLHDLCKALDIDTKTMKQTLLSLKSRYEDERRGITIVQMDNLFQMCTAPQNYEYVGRLHKVAKSPDLTQSLLETLAIISFRQPVTKPQIEEIRGVNADHAVNRLLERGLICEVGRSELPGRPILFGTTEEFLRYFGYSSIKELPNIEYDINQTGE